MHKYLKQGSNEVVGPPVTSHENIVMAQASFFAGAWQLSCNTFAANGERRDESKPESHVLTAYLHLMKLQSQRLFFFPHTQLL